MKMKKMLALEKEPYEKLQALIKELGWPKYWLARQIDIVIEGLLVVAEHAKKDLEDQKEMTKAEAMKRYEEMMRQYLEEKLED